MVKRKNKKTAYFLAGTLLLVILIGVLMFGLQQTVLSLKDTDIIPGTMIGAKTITNGPYEFRLNSLALQDTTINKGTVDFTYSYRNEQIGPVEVIGSPCPTYTSISTHHIDSTGKRIGGSWGTGQGDRRDQKTGDILEDTLETGQIKNSIARWNERNYFGMPNGEYEIVVSVSCRLSEITASRSEYLTIGEFKTGVKVTIFGESLHNLGTDEQAAKILELTENLQEQAEIIDSLQLTTQQKVLLIQELTTNINDQSEIIANLELTSEQQKETILLLSTNIEDQAVMINALKINLEQKSALVEQLHATNEEQAELIAAMKLSFTDQADIINALNNEIVDDAIIISNLGLSLEDQGELIENLKLTNEQQIELVSSLGLKVDEQIVIISKLKLTIEEERVLVERLDLTVQQQQSIIDSLSSNRSGYKNVINILYIVIIALMVLAVALLLKRKRK